MAFLEEFEPVTDRDFESFVANSIRIDMIESLLLNIGVIYSREAVIKRFPDEEF